MMFVLVSKIIIFKKIKPNGKSEGEHDKRNELEVHRQSRKSNFVLMMTSSTVIRMA